MPPENVDTIRRIHERWSRDRTIDPDVFHPDFEIRTPIIELTSGARRGLDGFEAWRAANDEAFADDEFEVETYEELGDRVLVHGRLHVTGRTSGLVASTPAVQLWSFTDGMPSSLISARTLDEALAAAG